MHKEKFVFSQLTQFLDRNHFNYLVSKYKGDHYVKHFTCWNQLLTLMFGQLSNRESLRDLIVVLEAHQSKCYHLGFGREAVRKTTLATANQNRDYRIFEKFACPYSNGQGSGSIREVSRFTHCLIWRHRYPHSTI